MQLIMYAIAFNSVSGKEIGRVAVSKFSDLVTANALYPPNNDFTLEFRSPDDKQDLGPYVRAEAHVLDVIYRRIAVTLKKQDATLFVLARAVGILGPELAIYLSDLVAKGTISLLGAGRTYTLLDTNV